MSVSTVCDLQYKQILLYVYLFTGYAVVAIVRSISGFYWIGKEFEFLCQLKICFLPLWFHHRRIWSEFLSYCWPLLTNFRCNLQSGGFFPGWYRTAFVGSERAPFPRKLDSEKLLYQQLLWRLLDQSSYVHCNSTICFFISAGLTSAGPVLFGSAIS